MGFKIGIIADSHGQADLIRAALAHLKGQGCGTFFHLGDICDSYHLAETAECLRLMRDHRVLAIKGNNDHVITQYHATHEHLNLSRTQMAYLKHLPLVRDYRNAVFAHSIPFDRELGLSCMIRPLDDYWINRYFCAFPDKILFRGHSHDPEIITDGYPVTGINPLPPHVPLDLKRTAASIITCGAITERLCAIWQPDLRIVTSQTF